MSFCSLVAVGLALSSAQTGYRDRFPLPGATVPSGFGVNTRLADATDRDLDRIRDLGAKWVRIDLYWSNVEREKGVYDFSKYDPVVEGILRRGMRPMLILDYGNRLHQVDAPRTREERAAFARYAVAAVKRYKGKGVLWEIWNEPNIRRFWAGQPSADEYAALVRVVGQAIRDVAPDEWIAGMAVSRFDWPFLERAFQEGALKYLDVVSVHPYRDNKAPDTVADEWDRLRTLVDRYKEPGQEVSLISGEWGYSTWSNGVSQDKQAQYAVRQYLSNIASGVPMSIWYSWKDRGADFGEKEDNFGLRRADGTPKAAYETLQSALRALDGYALDALVDMGDQKDHAAIFRKGSTRKLIAWTSDVVEREVSIPVSAGSFVMPGGSAGRTLKLKNVPVILAERW